MPNFHVLLIAALTGVLIAPPPQATPNDASLVHIEGAVNVNDQIVPALPSAMSLRIGAVVRTDGGQAAISLRKGGTLLVAQQSSVRIKATDFYNFNTIEVLGGSAIVISAESSPVVVCLAENDDAQRRKHAEVRLSSAGVFRFDVQPMDRSAKSHCKFRVYEGASAVSLTTPGFLGALRAGQTMTLPAGDMIPVFEFSPAVLDDFDRWSRLHAVKVVR